MGGGAEVAGWPQLARHATGRAITLAVRYSLRWASRPGSVVWSAARTRLSKVGESINVSISRAETRGIGDSGIQVVHLQVRLGGASQVDRMASRVFLIPGVRRLHGGLEAAHGLGGIAEL